MVRAEIDPKPKNPLVISALRRQGRHVNLHKTHLLSAALLGVFSTIAPAQSPIFVPGDGTQLIQPFEFIFRANANYTQNSQTVEFTGGLQQVFVRDGLVGYDAPCIAKEYISPGETLYENYFGFIIIAPPCALGTTGYLSSGDVNGDGVVDVINDAPAYLAVTSVNQAALIEPARPEKIQLVSAPPSLIPRPSGGFDSTSALLFFNIQTTRILQYKMSQYNFQRPFNAGQRGQFDDTFVEGTYRYNFPLVNRPTVPVPVDVNYFTGIDGFREKNNQKRGFRFIGLTFAPDGFALIDPSVPNLVKWQGNTPDKVAINGDLTQFRIVRLSAPGGPFATPNPASVIFPAFAGPNEALVTLQNPLETSYLLPPGIITPGATGAMQVIFRRNRGGVIADKSLTIFSVPVRFSPPGSPGLDPDKFIASKLPATASESDKAFNTDYDGDGMTNFAEWVFDSNPADASSVPSSPRLVFEEPASTEGITSKAEGGSGNWVFRVSKKQSTNPPLNYSIERSADMNEWIQVTNDDPNWELHEDSAEIKVMSRTSGLDGGNFFRVSVEASK